MKNNFIPMHWSRDKAKFLNDINDGIVIIDLALTVQFWNQAAEYLLGVKAEEALGRKWDDILKSYNGLDLDLNNIVDGLAHYYYVQLPTGEYKDLRISVSRLTGDSSFEEYFIIINDISEVKQVCRATETASLAKSELLTQISHEIRSALLGIMGYCDVLNGSNLSAAHADNVQIINNCALQLLGLANNIIDLSKAEIGQIQLNEKPFNLHRMLEQEILSLVPTAKAKGLSIYPSFAPDLPERACGDEVRIRQIISNLLNNAVKYTEQGQIEISAYHNEYSLSDEPDLFFLKLEVCDSGIGIDAEDRDKIFKPYIRAVNNDSDENSIGLGLAICKQLVEVMRGLIWFESLESGGTKFSVVLPLKMDNSIVYEELNQDEVIREKSVRDISYQVLLVEDRSVNRKLVTMMLEDMGCQVMTAANGKECLDILRYTYPNIIFMDMQMPVMDGFLATRLIRKTQSPSALPIVALTAHAMKSDIDKCLEAGCNYYLSKPFSKEELYEVLIKHSRSDSQLAGLGCSN